MTINGSSTVFSTWFIRTLLGLLLGILTWNGVREIGRNDKQDERLGEVEKAIIQIGFIKETVDKTDQKLDRLIEKRNP